MRFSLDSLKKKAAEASKLVNDKVPLARDALEAASKHAQDAIDISKTSIVEKTKDTQKLIKYSIEHERTQSLIANAKNAATSANKELEKYANQATELYDNVKEKHSSNVEVNSGDGSSSDIKAAINKLKSKDKMGSAGEVLSTAGGAAAGVAAAGTIASVAGATTIMGSSTLAGVLGGSIVAATPIGWVIGSAALAGAAGYGIAKMVRSGTEHDQIRKELVERLGKRLQSLSVEKGNEKVDILLELNQLLSLTIFGGLMTEEQANRTVELVEQGKLPPDIALKRIRGMALAAGLIEAT